MTDYKVRDIVLVPFPFSNQKKAKKRPVLILANIEQKFLPSLFIIAMITSQIDSEEILGDVYLENWKR